MTIDPKHDALLVIDLQPDFMPGGALAVAQGDQIVAPIAALLPLFQTVVATQDYHPKGHVSFASRHGAAPFSTIPLYGVTQELWPDHCVSGTKGADLHDGLPQERLTLILRKGTDIDVDSYSAFRENHGPQAAGERRTTGLGALLSARGIRRVFLCGLARDFCVRFSAVDAVSEGFSAVVLDDLCRDVFPDKRQETDALLEAASVKRMQSRHLLASSESAS